MTLADRQTYSERNLLRLVMPTPTIPDGFISRAKAPTICQRSKRQLERDHELAYLAQDVEVLSRFKLWTKDGTIRDAVDVTKEEIDELKVNGMNPIWIVEQRWLQETYGRKGEPKPSKTDPSNSTASLSKQDQFSSTVGQHDTNDKSETDQQTPLPDDIEFLKERIRTLERERQQEATRSEKREAKLFEQLAVKDRQISAWDEVTQGLTRGLATGQLMPMLAERTSHADSQVTPGDKDQPIEAHQASVVEESTQPSEPSAKSTAARRPRSRTPSKQKGTRKSKTESSGGRKATPARTRSKPRTKPAKPAKPSSIWNTPVKDLASQFFHR